MSAKSFTERQGQYWPLSMPTPASTAVPRPRSTCSATSGSVRPPCTRWCSRWSASAWSAASRGAAQHRGAPRPRRPPRPMPSRTRQILCAEELVGGRLDYLSEHVVAALVFRCREHVINVFIWPASAQGTQGASGSDDTFREGYHVLHWTEGGMNFWVVSDLDLPELEKFREQFQMQARS